MFTKTYLKQRNDLMDRFAPIGLNNLASEILSNVESFFLPLTDVTETKDTYEIHVALPGFKREEIAVNMEDQILTISGERKHVKDETKTYHKIETRYGKFERSFKLGNKADTGKVEAKFEDGLLHISVAKKAMEAAKTSVVEIK